MKAKKANDPNRLGFGRLMLWKSSDISAAWINLIMLNYLSIYATDTLGLKAEMVGILLLASKLVDACTDLVAGWLVDNTHTKLGKARPYELCIVGMTVCTLLIFCCDPAWATGVKYAWLFLFYLFTFSIFATLRAAAATPYTIRHFSNNSVLIRKVASYGGIITMAGSMACSVIFSKLKANFITDSAHWIMAVALVMVPATLIGVLRFLFCKEDPSVDAASTQVPIRPKEILMLFRRNKYVWLFAIMMLCFNVMTNLAVGTYFFKWIVGQEDAFGYVSIISIVLLPIMLFFPKLMQKLGSMCRMVIACGIVSMVGYLVIYFSGANLGGILGGSVLAALITLPMSYYGVLFIMDVCTYNEMIGLPRMDGSSGILSNFMSKTGAAVGSYVTGILLMLGGYVEGENVTVQPDSALAMIRLEYSIVPLICVAIIIVCCFAFEKLEKMIPEFEAKKKAEAEALAAKAESDAQ